MKVRGPYGFNVQDKGFIHNSEGMEKHFGMPRSTYLRASKLWREIFGYHETEETAFLAGLAFGWYEAKRDGNKS